MPFPLLAALPAIASVGAGVASWLGGREANATNVRLAREQMAFQERMSSTSAQRAVEDYSRAGLNPALAYDKPASSPSGALGRVEDAVTKGISTAMQARALRQSMEIARAQSQADLELKQSQTLRNAAEGATAILQGDLLGSQRRQLDQAISFRGTEQPFQQRSMAAKALLDELALPGARNVAEMERRLGQLSPQIRFWLGNARTASQMLNPLMRNW